MLTRILLTILVFSFLSFKPIDRYKSSAEIAIVADLSGSTNGLLDDLRDNLWSFINYFNRSNPEVEMRLAFVGFSRGSFGMENGYVRVMTNLTTHYDLISKQLFDMVGSVEKGDQYVGAALKATINNLSWSKDKATRRMILLFGNSRADLGNVDYRDAVQRAISKGIIVHSIYCVRQDSDPRILTKWYEIADGTGGELFKYRVTRRSPNKNYTAGAERLIDLNNHLNETFMPFNKKSSEILDLMTAADVNSLQMSERFFISRCYFKISSPYLGFISDNDLTGYYEKNKKLPDINRNYLPYEFRKSTEQELIEIAKIRLERRKRLVEKLNSLIDEPTLARLNTNPIDSIFAQTLSKHF